MIVLRIFCWTIFCLIGCSRSVKASDVNFEFVKNDSIVSMRAMEPRRGSNKHKPKKTRLHEGRTIFSKKKNTELLNKNQMREK